MKRIIVALAILTLVFVAAPVVTPDDSPVLAPTVAEAHSNGCYRRSGSYAGWYIYRVIGPDVFGYYKVFWIQSGLTYTIHSHYCPPYIWPN